MTGAWVGVYIKHSAGFGESKSAWFAEMTESDLTLNRDWKTVSQRLHTWHHSTPAPLAITTSRRSIDRLKYLNDVHRGSCFFSVVLLHALDLCSCSTNAIQTLKPIRNPVFFSENGDLSLPVSTFRCAHLYCNHRTFLSLGHISLNLVILRSVSRSPFTANLKAYTERFMPFSPYSGNCIL